ncbi:hypothetical protein [Spirosoma harenae]
MKNFTAKDNSPSNKGNTSYIMTDWLTVVSDFRKHYAVIDRCLITNTYESDTNYIGHCPKHDLVALQSRMRDELKKLIFDIDQVVLPEESDTLLLYLKSHTKLLKQLNRRAETTIRLATHPIFGFDFNLVGEVRKIN